MLDDMRIFKIMDEFAQEIQGGVCKDFMQIVDEFIEADIITEDEWAQNEMQICNWYDERFFTCERCGWTMPISQMDGDYVCDDCVEDQE